MWIYTQSTWLQLWEPEVVWLQIYPWQGELGKAGETGQVIISWETLSWLISCSSLFGITACSTGSFQPRATNLIYNVNCFSFSSPPAGRGTCTISVMLCVVLARMIIEPTKWFYFLLCAHCKGSSVGSILSLFIFILSFCLRSEIISAVFCLLLLYGFLNFLFSIVT